MKGYFVSNIYPLQGSCKHEHYLFENKCSKSIQKMLYTFSFSIFKGIAQHEFVGVYDVHDHDEMKKKADKKQMRMDRVTTLKIWLE